MIRSDTSSRMQNIIDRSEQNMIELKAAWEIREETRKVLDNQNASLSFLLEKAQDAKNRVFAPVEDPNQKGKGAKGKKK